jgi:hypothetical protein
MVLVLGLLLLPPSVGVLRPSCACSAIRATGSGSWSRSGTIGVFGTLTVKLPNQTLQPTSGAPRFRLVFAMAHAPLAAER